MWRPAVNKHYCAIIEVEAVDLAALQAGLTDVLHSLVTQPALMSMEGNGVLGHGDGYSFDIQTDTCRRRRNCLRPDRFEKTGAEICGDEEQVE